MFIRKRKLKKKRSWAYSYTSKNVYLLFCFVFPWVPYQLLRLFKYKKLYKYIYLFTRLHTILTMNYV